MPTLCYPAVAVPEHIITMEDTLALANRLHADHDQLQLVRRLITNTGVRQRHLVQPIEDTLRHPGFEQRNLTYVREAKARLPPVIAQALTQAGIAADEIDAIIYVSCTGFTMPPLTVLDDQSSRFSHRHSAAAYRTARLRRRRGCHQQRATTFVWPTRVPMP